MRPHLNLLLILAGLPALAQGAQASLPPGILRAQEAEASRPLIRKAVLQVRSASVFRARSVDLKALERQALERLAQGGVQVVEEKGADPGETWLITLDVYLADHLKSLYLCSSTQRCSLLADRGMAGNEAGKPQRVWFSDRVYAQKGLKGMDAMLRKAVDGTLEELLPPRPQTGGTPGDREHPVFQALDPARVVYMAPRPLYPIDVQVQKVYDTVVLDLLVDPEGRPVGVDAVSGPPDLLEISMRNALAWKFKPLADQGLPRWSRVRIPVTYWTGRPLSDYLGPRLR